jgi:hypothetical protein
MVEPLFSTTSTRAEVWLVLCELSLLHPSVYLHAHSCWKWMLTHMCWPLWCAELDERSMTCTTFCICVIAVDVNPDGWTTVFHHIYNCWGVAGFMWAESFTFKRGCVCSLVLEVDVHLYGLTTSMCRVDGRFVTCTTFCIWLLRWNKPWWLNRCFPPQLQELRCGWFYVSWVFYILAFICMLICAGSGC